MGTDIPTFRPGELIGDASRLQRDGSLIPSAESVPSRDLDERRANILSWTVMALLALFAVFMLFVIFVLD